MKQTKIIIIFCLMAFAIGFLVRGLFIHKPEEVIIKDIIRDTVEANMFHEMYLNERKKTDSLLKIPAKIKWKYDTIYTTIPDMPTDVLDSIIRANL